MGDVVSLVERAQEQYDEEEARKLQKKIAKNQCYRLLDQSLGPRHCGRVHRAPQLET